MNSCADLPRLLEAFFSERLMRQREASPHTIASYRDTFRLLLQFAEQRLHKAPSTLSLQDLDAPFISSFLETGCVQGEKYPVHYLNINLTPFSR